MWLWYRAPGAAGVRVWQICQGEEGPANEATATKDAGVASRSELLATSGCAEGARRVIDGGQRGAVRTPGRGGGGLFIGAFINRSGPGRDSDFVHAPLQYTF